MAPWKALTEPVRASYYTGTTARANQCRPLVPPCLVPGFVQLRCRVHTGHCAGRVGAIPPSGEEWVRP
eukprot:4138920-Prymnesium_polylepis.1